MSYGNVYVAHVSYGAKDIHTLKSFIEAESFEGPWVIIAYSPCTEHGYEMNIQHQQQELAVNTGHWPLYRFDPRREEEGKNPLSLDSQEPSVSIREFVQNEPRFRGLVKKMDTDSGKTIAFYDKELRKHFAVFEHLAGDAKKKGPTGA